MLHTVYCCALYIISKLRPNTSQAVPKTEGKIFQAIPETEGRIFQAVPLFEGLPVKSFPLRIKNVTLPLRSQGCLGFPQDFPWALPLGNPLENAVNLSF